MIAFPQRFIDLHMVGTGELGSICIHGGGVWSVHATNVHKSTATSIRSLLANCKISHSYFHTF